MKSFKSSLLSVEGENKKSDTRSGRKVSGVPYLGLDSGRSSRSENEQQASKQAHTQIDS